MSHEFTTEQIERGIVAALHSQDLHVVPSLLRVLAVKDPARAQLYLDAINLGIALLTSGREVA